MRNETVMARSVLYFFLVSVVAFIVAASFGYALEEPLSEKHVPLMEKLEKQIQSNYESIISWQGTVEYHKDALAWNGAEVKEGDPKAVLRTKIKFCADEVKNRYFTLAHPVEHWRGHLDKPQSWEDLPLDIVGHMFVDNLHYVYAERAMGSPKPPGSGDSDAESPGLVTIRSRKYDKFPINDPSTFFNPEVMLGQNTRSGAVGRLHYLAGTIRIGKGEVLGGKDFIEQDGDLFILRTKEDGKDIFICKFDLSKGGMVVYLGSVLPNGKLSTFEGKLTCTRGIWHFSELTWKLDERLVEKITMLESRINEPIDENLFTLHGFGVKRGCYVTDTIKETAYTITDKEFPLPGVNPTLPRNSYGITGILLMTTGGVLVLFALIMIGMRFIRKNNRKS